jgi:PAS domain S-box-containing protein
MTGRSTPSIRRKLTRLMMLTSTTTALLVCLGFVISDLVDLRHRLADDLSTLAQVVGSNSTVALTFGDRQGAGEVLGALRAKPSIVAAGIYTETGAPFARYEPHASIHIPRVLLHDGFYDRDGRLALYYGIEIGHKRVGTLYIVSDSRERNALLKKYAVIAGAIVLASLFFAFVLSSRLQRRISDPIVELARVARLVSQHKDYSVRANPRGPAEDDEIDQLMTGFNGMLAEIEQRDSRLLDAKSSAEKLAESNARRARESALILNSGTDGILGINLDNRISFINPAAERMLGATLADLETKSIHAAIHHSHPDGTPWSETDCLRTIAMRNGESSATVGDVFWRPDGTSFPVEYSSTAMFDEQGKQLGAVVMFRDVTERRAIERLKNEFVSTVSHELRTPLTSIRGALGLLSSGLLGPLQEKGQRMLAIAVSNTDRLVRLINDILDLERIESGKVELLQTQVDATVVMQQALEGVQSMGDEAGVRLLLVPATATLWGDSDRIIQTLTNLLGNAIKFSPRQTTVTLTGTTRGAEFVFCVADQGRGVPEEKLETIFDRFSQVDASDSRDKGGSGLGLAICQSIVNAHGGRIWAEKNEPAGSRFQFTIPLKLASTIPQAAGRADDDALAPSILMIEDDLDLARVMMTALQAHDIHAIHAGTGGEAIQMCSQQPPSLIVLDLALPDMDGFAVVRSLRETASLSRIPLIVYSAMDVGYEDQARLRLGPTEFLTKSRCSLAEFEEHVVRLVAAVANENQFAA